MTNIPAEAPLAPPAPPPSAPRGGGWRTLARWLARLLLAVALPLGAGVAWLILLPPDLDHYAPQLAAQLSQRTGLQVTLEGVSLRLGREIQVVGREVRAFAPGDSAPSPEAPLDLEERPPTARQEAPVAKAREVGVRFSPLAWLQERDPWVISLTGVQLDIRRTSAGEWRIGGMPSTALAGSWSAASNGQVAGAGDDWQQRLPRFASLSLTDATLAFTDERNVDVAGRAFKAVLSRWRLEAQQGDNSLQLETEAHLVAAGRTTRLALAGERRRDGAGRWEVHLHDLRPDILEPYLVGVHPLDGLRLPLSLNLVGQWPARGVPEVQWDLEGGEGALEWQGLFRWPFPVTRASAKGRARQTPEGWQVEVERFALLNSHGAAEGRFTLSRLGSGAPHLDLTASAGGVLTQHARFYYPVGIMHPKLSAWLDRSLQKGRAVKTTVRILGPALLIPFDPQLGDSVPEGAIFRIEGEVEGLQLEYFPGLPPLTDLSVGVVFDRMSMTAQVRDGRLGESRRVKGKVRIDDLVNDPVVKVEAQAEADLPGLWREVVASPTLQWDRRIGMEGAVIGGRVPLTLELTLPVWRPGDSVYDGHLTLDNATCRLPFLSAPIEELAGALRLTQEKLSLELAKARFDHMPLKDARLTVENYQEPSASRLAFSVRGEVGEGRTPQALQMLLSPRGSVSGEGRWTLKVTRQGGEKGFQLDLQGEGAQLGVQRGLGWEKQIGEPGSLEVRGRLDAQGRLELRRLALQLGNLEVEGGGSWNIPRQRGDLVLSHVRTGETRGRVALSRHEHWAARLEMSRLDLSPWLGEWRLGKVPEAASGESSAPETGKGDKGKGKRTTPEGNGVEEADPTERWPELEVVVKADRVLLASDQEGRELVASGVVKGRSWKVEQARVRHDADGESSLSATFNWLERLRSGPYAGELNVKTGDLGWLLEGLGWHDGWDAGKAQMAITLEGVARPGEPLWRQVSGEGWVDAQQGVIRRMRLLSSLLGLISLPDLPDLLVGQRPDLKGKGFYYDTFRGIFKAREGVWRSERLELAGPSMKIVASGTLDIPQNGVDLLVGLRPLQTVDNLVSKVPVVRRLVEGSRDTVVETLFHITGSPQDPHIGLQSMPSLAPGILRDILDIPSKWWNRWKKGKDDQEAVQPAGKTAAPVPAEPAPAVVAEPVAQTPTSIAPVPAPRKKKP